MCVSSRPNARDLFTHSWAQLCWCRAPVLRQLAAPTLSRGGSWEPLDTGGGAVRLKMPAGPPSSVGQARRVRRQLAGQLGGTVHHEPAVEMPRAPAGVCQGKTAAAGLTKKLPGCWTALPPRAAAGQTPSHVRRQGSQMPLEDRYQPAGHTSRWSSGAGCSCCPSPRLEGPAPGWEDAREPAARPPPRWLGAGWTL